MTEQAYADTKSILKSKTVWSLFLLLLTLAASKFGYSIGAGTKEWLGVQYPQLVDGLWDLALLAIAAWGRVKADTPLHVVAPKVDEPGVRPVHPWPEPTDAAKETEAKP